MRGSVIQVTELELSICLINSIKQLCNKNLISSFDKCSQQIHQTFNSFKCC